MSGDPQELPPGRPERHANRAGRGEPLVWLTALGIAIGLAMVATLLGVIVWNGVGAFWPRRVVEVAYEKDGRPERLLGAVAMERAKPGISGTGRETQYFVANRDVFGQTFRFVDDAAIRSRAEPADVVRIEREANGDVIGFPVELRRVDQPALPATDPVFAAALDEVVAEAADRRARIAAVEKGEIGENARRIKRLEGRLSLLPADDPARAPLEAEQAELVTAYAGLQARAGELRRRNLADTLVVRLADGSEARIPGGQLRHWYWPNRIGAGERLRLAAARAWGFVSDRPREANTEGGVFPQIFGTFVMTLLLSAFVVPLGVLAAIYLREYAAQGVFVRAVRIAVNNLAGVPSIVFGVFGLGFFVYVLGGKIDDLFFPASGNEPVFGTGGILWASLTLALMTVPVVIVATEEAIAAVPRGMREGSLACGASKWQTIQKIVLPASTPGIITGMILAMARGAGEVAPLMLVGVMKLAPTLPINGDFPFVHLDQKFMHLGFAIYDLGFQSQDSDAARPMVFAITLLLILLVLVLNLAAILLRDRIRRRFAVSAF